MAEETHLVSCVRAEFAEVQFACTNVALSGLLIVDFDCDTVGSEAASAHRDGSSLILIASVKLMEEDLALPQPIRQRPGLPSWCRPMH
jgi:hypothetical protein